MHLCNSCAKFACFSSELIFLFLSLCGQQHPKCELVIRLVLQSFFCNFLSSSNPTNKNVTESVLDIQTALSRSIFRIRHMFIVNPLTLCYLYGHLPKYQAFIPESPSVLTRAKIEQVQTVVYYFELMLQTL